MFRNSLRQSLRQNLRQCIRTVASAPSRNTIVPSRAIAAVRTFWELNRQIEDANIEPSDDWHSAQRAAQQLRDCSASVERSPAVTQVHTPALAPRGEVGQMTLEERKVMALEAIAEAARLWVQLNESNEEGRAKERM